jgi:prolyl oligopeptidase
VTTRLAALVCLVVLVAAGPTPVAAQSRANDTDPFLWLEELEGRRALDWAAAENAKTLAVLEKDPRFAGFYADGIRIGEAKDRIPFPSVIHGRVYNFWRDENHVRGIWRTTTLADYAGAEPAWATVLDLDELAKTEGKNWVWQGADCESPSRTRCLIALSEGGEDASTLREFDLTTRQFVADGFVLPRGKQNAGWVADDTLLVSREWVPGEMTTSGYAYVVKALPRGAPLSAATEVFRGEKSDMRAGPFVLVDGQGRRAVGIRRTVTFFSGEYHLRTPAGLRRLAVPDKAQLRGFVANRLLVRAVDPWTANGTTFAAGSLVSLDFAEASRDPARLQPALLYAPGPREALGGTADTRDRLVVTTLDNVRGRAWIFTPEAGGGWSRQPVDLPDNAAIGLAGADRQGSTAFLSVTGFLTPPTLMQVDATTGAVSVAKTTSPKFDASTHVVEQLEATSKDGTKIPYFLVRPKQMTRDGSTPTILNAYGGFEISRTPSYLGAVGKFWIERGGAYVVANIRGGGEFGPAWHESGLKTKRQVIYDDFFAVSKDLIDRKVTSPRRLGIQGGSNGGLLVGVAMTQHPELYNAVEIAVPLLDMLRYEQIQAGASWAGEYGSVSVPAERAFLARISPYHNLKPGVKYPEPFIWTTTKDDRVGPQHARKFAAKMDAMGLPYLFYEIIQGGHGAGTNIKETAFTNALQYTYFARKLMDPPAMP